ncbi:MAG: hypothetical protein K2P51_01780 [Rhabdochlamydiaceae bacterium]|nr:hypothetical protein [Rhabdochlamydiaceae bacterium]
MTNDPMTSDKTQEKNEIDQQLLPRLKLMGYILLVFSLCAIGYSFFEESSSELTEVETLEEEFEESLKVRYFNSYIVASSFITVGSALFLCAWQKQRSFRSQQKK